MSIGFSSAARNLFLLGSSGEQVVTNFFKTIDQSAGTDGAYIPDEIKYNFVDQKFVLAGSAHDSNTKGFGWFEKRDQVGSAEWDVRVEAGVGVNTTLRAMELDVNDNLIVVGRTGDVPWIAKYSNGGVIDWQSTTNTAEVEYTGIASDNNGNYYACGSTILVEKTAFVEKFDTNGTPGWGKAAFMLGRDVVLYNIAANSRGEVVAVGYLEDNLYYKGYIVKIDTNTGEVLWDRTLQTDDYLECTDVYIDSNDQIYVTAYKGSYFSATSYLIKYTAEGNIIWQRETDNDTSADETIIYQQVHSDGETEQTVVFGTYKDGSGNEGGVLSKYSKDGSLVWRRTLFSTYNNSDSFGVLIKRGIALDADPSFYYLLFVDDQLDELSGIPDRYTYGKVSSSGNGLGAFSYSPDAFDALDYIILSVGDKIGRLSDGSVRQDISDLITYPFNANKLLFDDLATQVSNKKRQMDDADSFEYSGSPAIRPADFQELNLLGDNVSDRIWNDTSGKGNDGVASLTEPFFGAGSTSFDGTGDNLRVSTSNVFDYGTNNFTIEFWWYPTSTDRQALFHGSWGEDWSIGIDFNGSANNQKLGMWASSSGTSWDMLIADAGGNGITTGTPNQNSWNHIAYVRNGTTFTLYLNGTNVGQVTGISAAINSKTTTREQVIGAWWNSEIAMSDVHGYLSNYRIVIGSALYTSNFTPPTTQLTNIPGTVLLTCQGDTIADASANNFTITANGNASPTDDGPTWNASGYWEFDGTNKKISVPYNEVWTLPNDFTLEAWIYRNSAFNANWWQDAIMGHDDGSGQNNKWIFSHNGTSLFFHTNTTSGSAQNIQAPTGWVPTNSVWYNVVITRSENTYTFYQNSTSLGTVTNSEAIPVASASLTIGNAEGGGLFDGRIGEVRIYPRALTAAQVFQNYNATKSKYINEAPDTAPKITSGVAVDANLLLNYDFGNRATYDRVENLVSYSEQIDNSYWIKFQTTVIPNATLSPHGDMTADLLLETNSNGQHNIQKSNFTGTGNHTLSIYAKAYGLVNRKLRIATYDPLNGGTDAVTAFDLINGTFQTGESGGDFYGSAEMIFVGNGWYRCIVYTENLIDPAGIYFGLSNGVYDFNYQGDGTSGIYVWGAQLERGFTAGRYIKTFGTAITAPTTVKNLSSTSYAGTVNGGAVFNSAGYFEFNGSTDRRIIVDTNSSINSLNGAFTIEFWGNIYMSDDDNATFILDARNTNSSASPSWYIYETDIGGLPRINLQINITSGPSVEISTSTVFTPNQLSGWKHFVFSRTGIGSNQSFVYVNGSLDTTGTLPNNITSGHTKLHIGANSSGSQRLNGNIGEVRFYNRALSATEVSKNFNATSGKYGV